MILAGDIGGTHTRLAFFEWRGSRPVAVVGHTYPSREHAGLDEILDMFIAAYPLPIERAGFGIAGVVRNGRCKAVNLPWIVDAAPLAHHLGLVRVALVNDLEAAASGIAVLEPNEYFVLNTGTSNASGNMAVIAAGTGLGEAGIYWNGKEHHPFATEGGHADFAPREAVEMDLCLHLRSRFGRVSVERIVSGPGLVNIFLFLKETGPEREPEWLAREMEQSDPSAAIAQAALQQRCPLSRRALDLFVSLYGAEAGNLALKVMATGGLWIGGGVAPKILPKLKDPEFMEAFTAKGRMKPLMESIPVRVILNEKTGLLGAALRAAR